MSSNTRNRSLERPDELGVQRFTNPRCFRDGTRREHVRSWSRCCVGHHGLSSSLRIIRSKDSRKRKSSFLDVWGMTTGSYRAPGADCVNASSRSCRALISFARIRCLSLAEVTVQRPPRPLLRDVHPSMTNCLAAGMELLSVLSPPHESQAVVLSSGP